MSLSNQINVALASENTTEITPIDRLKVSLLIVDDEVEILDVIKSFVESNLCAIILSYGEIYGLAMLRAGVNQRLKANTTQLQANAKAETILLDHGILLAKYFYE